MKQGTVITRIMIVLLFFMVCAYLIFSAIRTLDERSYTVTTYAHTLDDAAETTGLLIRAETVVTGQAAAIVDVLPDQGEKVRSGSPVAYLYQDESALDRRRQLRTLTLEEEQLMYALQGQDGTDASRLEQSIVDAMVGLRTSAVYGDLTSLEEQSLSFKSLVIRHGYASDAGVEELTAAKAALDGGKAPMELIDGALIPALDRVGAAFETGKLYLPQLLMSAEAAKAVFELLRGAMTREGERPAAKAKVVLSTVKGDVHDIGKNIVKVLLENYGYQVVDLGKDVSPQAVADAVVREHAAFCGLSALMTTTVGAMEETIALLRREAPWCRIMVGGAVLTEDYARRMGADFYGRDAMSDVRYADGITGAG